jgi:hypothetical protein
LKSQHGHLAFYKITPQGNSPAFLDILPYVKNSWGWEGSFPSQRCWTKGSTEIVLVNYGPNPVDVRVSFDLATLQPRRVHLKTTNKELSSHELTSNSAVHLEYLLNLKPGKNSLYVETDRPGELPGNGDLRELAFAILKFSTKAAL